MARKVHPEGMWTEVILSRDDLVGLLASLLPLHIRLDEEAGDHSISLTDLGQVHLVADVGLRIECKALVRWPLLGVHVPIEVSSLTLVLIPTVEPSADGDRLVFRVSVEHAGFAGLPHILDDRITSAINEKLSAPQTELAWCFTRALTHRATLPAILEPLDACAVQPAWGRIRITEEALVFAASFRVAFHRRGDPTPRVLAAPSAARAPRPLAPPPKKSLLAGRGLQVAAVLTGALLLIGGTAVVSARKRRALPW